MRFLLFAVVTVRIADFWNVMPCGLVEISQHIRWVCCFHLQTAQKRDAVVSSKRLVNFYHTTLCEIPECSNAYLARAYTFFLFMETEMHMMQPGGIICDMKVSWTECDAGFKLTVIRYVKVTNNQRTLRKYSVFYLISSDGILYEYTLKFFLKICHKLFFPCHHSVRSLVTILAMVFYLLGHSKRFWSSAVKQVGWQQLIDVGIYWIIILTLNLCKNERMCFFPPDLTFLQSLNLTKMVTCRLNPLKVCLPVVAQNFAAVTRTYQLAYCYTVLQHNARFSMPVIYQDHRGYAITRESTLLDTFFPFDPFILCRSVDYYSCSMHHR